MIIDVDSKHKIVKPDAVGAGDYLDAVKGMKALEEQTISGLRQNSDRIENALAVA